MIGLPLNESTRAAALDGALSFSILLQNQRELTLNTAHSSVSGLLAAIQAAPADYAKLLTAASDAFAVQGQSAEKLSHPRWSPAASTTEAAIRDAIAQELADGTAALRTQANTALSAASSAKAAAQNPSPEYTLATALEQDAATLLDALNKLEANQDAAALTQVSTARNTLAATLSSAQAQLSSLSGQNPAPAARIANAQAIIAAAQDLVGAADKVATAAVSAVAAVHGETPTSFELTTDSPPATHLTVWGRSGVISLTDASGRGVLISADGRVDAVPSTGEGWQFKSDSTFLLPDGTKISVSPGNPASVLATRGQQQISIHDLQHGVTPKVAQSASGGLEADAARNDGHGFVMGSDQSAWTLAGAPLGSTVGAREIVATAPTINEHAIDVTSVTLPGGLAAQLTALGIDPNSFDANHDGRFSNEELQELVEKLDSAVEGAAAKFDGALQSASTAIASLLKLNQFLEKLLSESDRRQQKKADATAEEREQLRQIQSDLNEAHRTLKAAPAPVRSREPAVIATATVVLNQVARFSPGRDEPPVSGSPTPSTVSQPTDVAPRIDPLAQSLRRAQRVLGRWHEPAAVPTSSTPALTSPTAGAASERGENAAPVHESESTPALGTPGPASDSGPATGPAFATELTSNIVSPATEASPEPLVPQPVSTASSKPAAKPSDGDSRAATPTTPGPRTTDRPRSADLAEALGSPVALPHATPRPATVVAAMPGDSAAAPSPAPNAAPPRQTASVQDAMPGTGFPATGPDPVVGPDPTSGSSGGFAREFQRRLSRHHALHQQHAARAQAVQGDIRSAIERFFTLVNSDADLRQVFAAEDLTEDQRAAVRSQVAEIERDLGLTWGGEPDKAPGGEATLNTRLFKSGLMI